MLAPQTCCVRHRCVPKPPRPSTLVVTLSPGENGGKIDFDCVLVEAKALTLNAS
jgi:hypothetical protein